MENPCLKNSIYLIEDSAQALGSFYPNGKHMGTVGIAGSISFSMPKLITTGQGGAVLSNSDELLTKLRQYRDFGRSKGGGTDEHSAIGLNMKFTDLQAILGRSQLSRISRIIKTKKDNFNYLHHLLTMII